MALKLSELARRQGYSLVQLACVDSTNTYAAEYARCHQLAVDCAGCFIVADEQFAGRGRHSSVWKSGVGNFYCSLLLQKCLEPSVVAALGFVAGVSLWQAVQTRINAEECSKAAICLKWPNDLLIEGKKTAGILLETFLATQDALTIVLGVGVNIKNAPIVAEYLTTNLTAHGYKGDRDTLFKDF